MEEKKISVIVPIYKVESYLDKCINSIVNQSYLNLEIILVDDGSPDHCPQLCDEWAKKDKRIKVFHKKNGGVSSARNLGLLNAYGEYICFVDADDYLDNNYIELLARGFNDNVDLVVCGYKKVSSDGKVQVFDCKSYNILNPLESAESFMKYVQYQFCDISCNKLFKKNLISFNFDETLPLGEDRLFNLNYIKAMKNNIKVVDSIGYNYVTNYASASYKVRSDYADLQIKGIINLKNFLAEYYSEIPPLFYKHLNDIMTLISVRCDKSDYKIQCLKFFQQDSYDLLKENYKPVALKDKVKNYLIIHKKFGLLRSISKLHLKLK